MPTYKIVRFFQDGDNEDIAAGLTLVEAQAHCSNRETSSRTCTGAVELARTDARGPWFDGYREED